MAGTTPIKGWPYPSETDSPDVPRDVKNLADALEVVGKNTFGVLSARPTSGMTEGDRYLVVGDSTPANNGMEFVFNGTAWITALSGGAWTSLSLASGITAFTGDYTPTARVEGDRVWLRGTVENTSGGNIAANATIFTLPSGMGPSTTLVGVPAMNSQALVTEATYLQVSSTRAVSLSIAIATSSTVALNGLNFSLS